MFESLLNLFTQFVVIINTKITSTGVNIKSKLDTIRIPSLLSFLVNPSAKDKFNPTLEEAQATAPEPSKNWIRLGLDNMTSLGVPVYKIFLITGLVIGIYLIANPLKFLIDIISQFGVFLLLLIPLYWIIKKLIKG